MRSLPKYLDSKLKHFECHYNFNWMSYVSDLQYPLTNKLMKIRELVHIGLVTMG